MYPSGLFRHCPRCGAGLPAIGSNPLECPSCGFAFFFNPTVSSGAFLFDGDRALFFRRSQEPAKGKLAVPGGFIDVGETAEAALRREVREEVGLEIEDIRYLGSCTNDYPFRGVTYPVVDLVYRARAVKPENAVALDGVSAIEWLLLREVKASDLAFPSLRMGWELLR